MTKPVAGPRSEGDAFSTRRGLPANPVRLPDPAAVPANDLPPLNVVWFAGGGGSSEGMREAGFAPDYALNHNATALWMHQVNHPDCTHLCDDATAVHPMTLEPGRRIRAFWASPDCTHFSVARGSAPKSPRIRGLAWCILPWAKLRRPGVIFIENVKEFLTWGPLDAEGQPVKRLRGETFRKFVKRLTQCGYDVEHRELNAADHGAPTTRKRLFIIARCDGEPIVWPAPTHAPRKDAARLGLKPYVSAASIIDWSEPCPSIFLSQADAKAEGLRVKRPLVAATLSRIAKGIERYIIRSAEPFIFGCGGRRGQSGPLPVSEAYPTITGKADGWLCSPVLVGAAYGDDRKGAGLRAWEVQEPVRTVTGGGSGGFKVASAYLVPSYGEAPGQVPRTGSVEEPYPTVVAHGNGGHLVAATLARQFGASVGSDAAEPIGAVMPRGGGKTQLIAATLDRHFGTNVAGADIADPTPTIMSEGGGGKLSVISANLTSYYGIGVGSDVSDPARTLTGKDRFGLTTAFLEQANTGVIGHDVREGVSTITGRATQQRLIEARLQSIGASPSSRRRAVLDFLWAHFGEPTESEWGDPTGTERARLRFGLVIIGGTVWEIADIGMRMLKVRELFSAQGFRPDYIIDRDPWGRSINGTAATLMVGNSVPPPLARVLAAANLNDPEPVHERVAA